MKTKLRATVRFSDDGVSYADDGRYRLWLEILLNREGVHLHEHQRTACALMMNPSTARAEDGYLVPDPTVTKLCGYARRYSCDRLIVVNAFGIRLTDSKLLHSQQAPVGNPLNDVCIVEALYAATVRIVAWGNLHKSLEGREKELRVLLRRVGRPVYSLKVNDNGSPSHPLYLSADAPLIEFLP